jgi:hypothetical protein
MKKIQIPLYNNPPEGLKQLEELEKIVLSRINILEFLENKEKEYLKTVLNREEYLNSLIELSKYPENDVISHFLLCVANCNNDQTRIT